MATTKTAERPPTRQTADAEHRHYVPDDANIPEFTWSAVTLGSLLGIVFGASSLYLVLKVGMTVSASIPVAVLSITLFRVFSRLFGIRPATILENNIVQTAGSAGESIAFGVGVTMPALMILGFEMDIGRVMVVAILGGLLGILMMIPLRRAFIVKQHGKLKYPEGTACADVLIVGEQGGSSATTVFTGFGIAFVYQFLMQGMKLWKDAPERALSWFKGAVASIEVNPALLGVGYIIGTRISCVMAAGGVLASFVLIPMIRLFGDRLSEPIFPATTTIHEMSADDIWKKYILYIGAGAVAAGGIISLVQALPLIIGSIRGAVRDMRAARTGEGAKGLKRTNRDLPLWIVGIGSLALVIAIWSTSFLHKSISWIPELEVNEVGALMIVLFGFLFVTVSSRLTGEIGSSSNPISGMTVATLLLTCLVFFLWHHQQYADEPGVLRSDLLAALSVAAVVCIAASNGGTTSQDLKTGYLVGATPRSQQLAIVVGTLTSALVIGIILVALNNASTVYSARQLPRLRQPLDVGKLPEMEQPRDVDDTKVYHVWHVVEGNAEGVPPAKYLVDDAGQIRYLVDPGINGSLEYRDNGAKVLKFKAPKAQLMALIANGILRQKLPWALVLLGVSIAVVLELCSVPSLPFAVGVYLPMSSSMPIFVGGLVRFVADRFGRTSTGKKRTEAESDMSPGVLLSTGYIAGGAIAGVLIAFLSFSNTIPDMLARYQNREAAVAGGKPFNAQLDEIAAHELGDSTPEQIKNDQAEIEKLRWEMIDINRGTLAQYATVRAGTNLKLPGDKQFRVQRDETLGAVAKEVFGDETEAKQLLELNEGVAPPPDSLPAETRVKVPQHTLPALVAFGILALCLLLVGLGCLMRSDRGASGDKPRTKPDRLNPDGGDSQKSAGRRDDTRL
jgi:putative OPT family oligopeptide transporter